MKSNVVKLLVKVANFFFKKILKGQRFKRTTMFMTK